MEKISKKWLIGKLPYIETQDILITKIVNMLKGLASKSSDDNIITWFEKYLDNPIDVSKTDMKLIWVEKELSKFRKLDEDKKSISDIPFNIYGESLIDPNAVTQMKNLLRLPITVAGSLMPDAHLGYGIPIGGVAATHKDYVIPYAVGSDISCMMALSIYDISPIYLTQKKNDFLKFLNEKTYFGKGCNNGGEIIDDSVLHLDEWKDLPMYKKVKPILENQLGTSGSGNHFVEWGIVTLENDFNGIPKGQYVALMSHSGSRGVGYNIADYYVNKAKDNCQFLDNDLKNLSFLNLNSDLGKEYWAFMNMAGKYASACHNEIHLKADKFMKNSSLLKIENYHNFCWQEEYNGELVNVHRKGATPAHKGVLGIIPGSMSTPAYIVEGLGNVNSINSASHGSGRIMSRNQAKSSIMQERVDINLKKAGVSLIGGGLDEAPMVYKNIDDVMSFQTDLVTVKGKFMPKYVRMADDGTHED
jgi:tRNA-splicing ligase RtcB